jgi:hypothetical protein
MEHGIFAIEFKYPYFGFQIESRSLFQTSEPLNFLCPDIEYKQRNPMKVSTEKI